jgi:hypothetical protein
MLKSLLKLVEIAGPFRPAGIRSPAGSEIRRRRS